MHVLSVWHTHVQCLCSTVLPDCCFGRCVRYTCWQTRFRCVRLSGSGCLTPPASPVWRQVRGGHISNVLSDLIPCEPSRCHWKPWFLYSASAAQPWSLTNAFKVKLFPETYTLSFGFNFQISVCVYKVAAMIPGLCSWCWYSWPLVFCILAHGTFPCSFWRSLLLLCSIILPSLHPHSAPRRFESVAALLWGFILLVCHFSVFDSPFIISAHAPKHYPHVLSPIWAYVQHHSCPRCRNR